MGAHSNAENLEPAILGLRIRPIQRELFVLNLDAAKLLVLPVLK
jgi:hypothetical protein